MEALSKVFLLFFLLPDWLKLNHLRSWMECGFSGICSTVAEIIGVTDNAASFGAKESSENHIWSCWDDARSVEPTICEISIFKNMSYEGLPYTCRTSHRHAHSYFWLKIEKKIWKKSYQKAPPPPPPPTLSNVIMRFSRTKWIYGSSLIEKWQKRFEKSSIIVSGSKRYWGNYNRLL